MAGRDWTTEDVIVGPAAHFHHVSVLFLSRALRGGMTCLYDTPGQPKPLIAPKFCRPDSVFSPRGTWLHVPWVRREYMSVSDMAWALTLRQTLASGLGENG